MWIALVVIAWAIAEVAEQWIRERAETRRLRLVEEARTEQLRIREASKSGRKRPVGPTSGVGDGELGRLRGSGSVLPGQRGNCWVIPTGMTCVNEE